MRCTPSPPVNLNLRGGYQSHTGEVGERVSRILSTDIEHILAYEDEDRYPSIMDEDEEALEGEVMYQTPIRILDYDSWVKEATPQIALRRLLKAARMGEDDEIRLMVAYLNADINGCDPRLHFTAMHWASLNGHTSTVSLLLSMEADANCRDVFGSTPLHYAAETGRVAVVSLLLKGGARPFLVNDFGRTALHWAEECKRMRKGDVQEQEKIEITKDKLDCIIMLRKAMGYMPPIQLQELYKKQARGMKRS